MYVRIMSNQYKLLMSHMQQRYADLKNKYPNSSRNFAILKISVEDAYLLSEYKSRVDSHNNSFCHNLFADSGFDLLVPSMTTFQTEVDAKYIDMLLKSEMVYCDVATDALITCAYYIHPRSSISKTPLMLANHTGIIDSGYRGSLIGAFRRLCASNSVAPEYVVEKHTRLLQVCHPTLCPIYVVIVDSQELSTSERGDGGFGSTGV